MGGGGRGGAGLSVMCWTHEKAHYLETYNAGLAGIYTVGKPTTDSLPVITGLPLPGMLVQKTSNSTLTRCKQQPAYHSMDADTDTGSTGRAMAVLADTALAQHREGDERRGRVRQGPLTATFCWESLHV